MNLNRRQHLGLTSPGTERGAFLSSGGSMAKARRKRKNYTSQERTMIMAAASKDGLTAAQVQKKFGVTPVTYYSWRKKTGMTRRRGGAGTSVRVAARGGDLNS